MIKYHEVVSAAHKGANKAQLIEIAGSAQAVEDIIEHTRVARVQYFNDMNAKASMFDFTYSALRKGALADLMALEKAYAT